MDQRNHFNSALHLISANRLEKEIKAIPFKITEEKYKKKADLTELIENQKREIQTKEKQIPEPSTSTSRPSITNNKMDRAEKSMKSFEKQIKHLAVDRRKKMYKNKRKLVHEKNLRQDPAINP